MKNYYESHKEELKLKMNQYYQEHKDELKSKMNEYYRLNRSEMKDKILKKYHENKSINEKHQDMRTYHRNYYHLRRKNSKEYINYHSDYYQLKKQEEKNENYFIPIRKYETFLKDGEIPRYTDPSNIDKPIISQTVKINSSQDNLIVEF